jgi:phage tail sheath protein FI
MANLGVNVIEVDGRSSPAIAGAPISTAAFLVRSERGIPNLPVPVQGFADFANNFGSYIITAFGAFAVRGFFDNSGTQAYAVRIVGPNGRAASVMLGDRQGAPASTLLVQAGMRGRPDPGEWGNSLTVQIADHPRGTSIIPAQVIGAAQSEPFVLADGQQIQFTVTVRGVSSTETVTFHTADFANIAAAAASEVAAAIGRQTTLVQAGVTLDGRIALAAARAGQDAGLARLVVAGSAAAGLGFTGPSANGDGALIANATLAMLQSVGGFLRGSAVRIETRGNVVAQSDMAAAIADGAAIQVTADGGAAQTIVFRASDFVNGVASISPGEVVAAINRQAQGFTAALSFNSRLILLSNSFGPSSTVAVAAGAPDATGALGLTGAVAQAGSRNFGAIDQVSEAYRFITFTLPLPATPITAARIQSVEFDLAVGRGGIEVERFESLSREASLPYSVQAVINDAAAGSRYIMVTPQVDNVVGANAPAIGSYSLGSTAVGASGDPPADTNYIGDPLQRSGLYALDTTAFQLLAIPETTAQGVVAAALAYCQNRGDAMFVGTTPRGLDLAGAKTYAASFRGRKVYGVLYYPWIQIVNPLDTTGTNPRIFVPPVGHILGAYARIGDARGVWKAPAGDEAQLANALAVDVNLTDVDHTDLVKNGGVSAIRAIPGSGIVIDSSRTLSTDTRWLYISTRRLFNFVKASLRDGLRWVAQEPHDENLRRAVQFNVVRPFLLGLWAQGAFGSDPADQTFTIKCDADNNPPADVALGLFKLEVYFYPVRPVETIIIVVGQQDTGATATDQ